MSEQPNEVTLSPEAVYFRSKFHASEDQNALIVGELGRARQALQNALQQIEELRGADATDPEEGEGPAPAKKAAAKKRS